MKHPYLGQGEVSSLYYRVPLIEVNRYKDYLGVNFSVAKVCVPLKFVPLMEVSQSRGFTLLYKLLSIVKIFLRVEHMWDTFQFNCYCLVLF